jgi:monofunctional glycosyltransferase
MMSDERTPRIAALRRVNPRRTSFMRQRGTNADVQELWTPLPEISPWLIGAVIQAEDPRFFEHRGVNLEALAHKVSITIRRRRRLAGTSTVTQQLARNLYLTPDRALVRKLREFLIALRLETALSKLRILELYLNVIEWGVDVWGCRAASEHYFGKRPDALNAFESTFLASLIPAPRSLLTGRNAARSRYVQLRVAHQMLFSGLITPAECVSLTRRVRRMHDQLAAGIPLARAMADPDGPTDLQDVGTVADLCRILHVEPIAPAAASAAQYGCPQQLRVWRELRTHISLDALTAAVNKGCYDSLRPLLKS